MASAHRADPTPLPGVVVYRRQGAGEVDAVWRSQGGSGLGFATGGPAAGFVGRFRVRYSDQDGGNSASYDLDIAAEDEGYRLTWSAGGAIHYAGVGIRLDQDTLVASYARAGEQADQPDDARKA